MSALTVRLAAVAAVMAGLLASAGGAEAAASPAKVAPTSRLVQGGGRLTATVALRGGRTARLAFLLSKDRRRSRGDLSLGSKRVKASHARQATVKLRLPARAQPEVAYLLVCGAGPRSTCAASAKPLAVLARPKPLSARPNGAGAGQSAAIGPQGGVVSVAEPGGVSATLSIPVGALPQTTTITLTPLVSVGTTLPGPLTGGVELAPQGLALARPATLKLSRPGTVGFAFDPGGHNLHLVPVRGGGVPISRLGGAGMVLASSAALRKFAAQHVAADPLSELEQLLAVQRQSGKARDARAGGGSSDELASYVLATALQIEAQAGGDFLSALALYEQWTLIAQGVSSALPGLESQVKSALIAAGLKEALQDSNRCAAGDLSRVEHMLALANAGTVLSAPTLTQAAQTAVADCLQFDLKLDSQIHHDPVSDGDPTLDFHYQAEVPLDFYADPDPAAGGHIAVHGSDSGNYVSASGSASSSDQCVWDNSPETHTMTMPSTDGGIVTASADWAIPVAPEDKPPIKLTLDSSATENYHFQTTDPGGDPRCAGSLDVTVPQWWTQVSVGAVDNGEAEWAPDVESIVITLDPPSPGDLASNPALLAEQTISPYAGVNSTGTTKIQLIHDPRHLALPSK